MDLKRLKYFLEVAECGSFRGASAKLNISQSALSRRVQELEQELGFPLFDRGGPRPRLLPQGEALVRHATIIFRAVGEATLHMARFSAGQIGNLRLGLSNMAGQLPFVADAIRQFTQARPDVRLSIEVMNSSPELEDALHTGRLDLVVCHDMDSTAPEEERLILREFYGCLAVPAGHRLAGQGVVSVRQLTGEKLIIFPRSLEPASYDCLIAAFVDAGVPLEIVQEVPSEEVRLALTVAHLGVCFVSSSVFERNMPGGLTFLRIADFPSTRTMGVHWMRESRTPLVDAFVAAVVEASEAPVERALH